MQNILDWLISKKSAQTPALSQPVNFKATEVACLEVCAGLYEKHWRIPHAIGICVLHTMTTWRCWRRTSASELVTRAEYKWQIRLTCSTIIGERYLTLIGSPGHGYPLKWQWSTLIWAIVLCSQVVQEVQGLEAVDHNSAVDIALPRFVCLDLCTLLCAGNSQPYWINVNYLWDWSEVANCQS